MLLLNYDTFYIACLDKSSIPEFRSSFFWADGLNGMLDFVDNIDDQKLKYSYYWKENTRKEHTEIYDEVIEKSETIRLDVTFSEKHFFILRSHSYELNPIEELDFLIWSNKIQKEISLNCQKAVEAYDAKFCEKEIEIMAMTENKFRRTFLNFESSMNNLNRRIKSTIF